MLAWSELQFFLGGQVYFVRPFLLPQPFPKSFITLFISQTIKKKISFLPYLQKKKYFYKLATSRILPSESSAFLTLSCLDITFKNFV